MARSLWHHLYTATGFAKTYSSAAAVAPRTDNYLTKWSEWSGKPADNVTATAAGMGCVHLGLSSLEDISNVQWKYLGKQKCRKKPAPHPLCLETETTELKNAQLGFYLSDYSGSKMAF